MSGATKGGGVLDRHGLHDPTSRLALSSSPLSSRSALAAAAATASNELNLDDRHAAAGMTAVKSLSEEASSRVCVNGAAAVAAAAAISAAS